MNIAPRRKIPQKPVRETHATSKKTVEKSPISLRLRMREQIVRLFRGATTEIFVIAIAVLSMINAARAQSGLEFWANFGVFVATTIFGVLLVRSVKKEIRLREKINVLARRLAETNYELARSNEQLKILDQRKSEFVSLVSHQLRAPITAIKGYASLLLEESYGKLAEATKAPIERVFLSSQRLAEMVGDFLDLSNIEQGKMSYTCGAVDLRAVVRDVVDEFLPVATRKGIALHCDLPRTGSFIVSADGGKLRQVISNLLDNSIKYTPKGSVHVSLEKEQGRGTTTFRIRDTGIGISREDREHIFEKFTRAKEGQAVSTIGSGLGLYVAKKMLEAQKGKVWVESEGPGTGSTFVVELQSEGVA